MSPEVPEGQKRDKKIRPSSTWGTNEGQNWFLHCTCFNYKNRTIWLIFNVLMSDLCLKLSICIKFANMMIINVLTNCYFPMQELENSEYQLVKYSSNEYWAEIFLASDRKWCNSLLHSILHFPSPFISPKLIFSHFL